MIEATGNETRVSDYAYGDDGSTRPLPVRRKRRRRGLTFLLTLVILLGAIAIVGDRVAASYATKELRTQLVSQLDQANVKYDGLGVSIGGFPFLTQVYRGNYDKITIDLANVQLPEDGRNVTLPSLHVVANGVDADTKQVIEGTAKVNARQVSGTAVVAFSTLETLVDYSAYHLSDVKYSEQDGGLHVSGKAALGTVEVPISATADLAVVQGQIQVKLHDLKAVNVPAPGLLENYLGGLAQQSLTAQLPKLPFGLNLDKVAVTHDGLAVSATAHDVALVN